MIKTGIVGYAINSGIGCLISDIKRNLPIDSHLVIPHPVRGIDKKLCDKTSILEGDVRIDDWLDSINVLIIIETPFIHGLLRTAYRKKRKIIAYVNIDWFNPKIPDWVFVHHFICPNKFTLDQLKGYPVVDIPCCVDTDLMPFTQRYFCNKYLFNNGWGGWKSPRLNIRRKNWEMVKGSFEYLTLNASTATGKQPGIPIIVNSQIELEKSAKDNFDIRIGTLEKRADLYKEGDIYLAPTAWEGAGLHILEAMASGLPVITTNGEPMNEYITDPEFLIKTTRQFKDSSGLRYRGWVSIPDQNDLMYKVLKHYKTEIQNQSSANRELVEKKYSWKVNRDKWLKLIETGFTHEFVVNVPVG